MTTISDRARYRNYYIDSGLDSKRSLQLLLQTTAKQSQKSIDKCHYSIEKEKVVITTKNTFPLNIFLSC